MPNLAKFDADSNLVTLHSGKEIKSYCAFRDNHTCGLRCAAMNVTSVQADGRQFVTCSRMTSDTWLIGEIIKTENPDA